MAPRILVVEDSPTQAEHLHLLLEAAGYAVAVARDGQEGLEEVGASPPDLVIADVVMPRMDGYTFCAAVKASDTTRHIPVVLLTERNAPMDILRGLQFGADNFITKPFEDDVLLERVRRIVERLDRRRHRMEIEVTLRVGGRDIAISADKQQIVELLLATFEELCRLNDRLTASQQAVDQYARSLEAQVRERTAELQGLFDGVPVGLLRTTPEGHLLDANPALVEMLGYPDLESLRAVSMLDLYVDPADRTRWRDAVEREGVVTGVEVQLRRRDGTTFWQKIGARAVRDAGGRVLHYEVAAEDVTAVKRAEGAAAALAEVGRELVRTLDLGQVAQRIASTVLDLFRARRSLLYRLDEPSSALVCLATAGEGDPGEWIGLTLPPGVGLASRALAEGRPIWSTDLLADETVSLPEWLRERLRSDRYRSVVAVPLSTMGRAVGALVLGDAAGRRFTESELRLLAAFGDQAALALRNARLFEETQERLRQTETLLAVGRSIASTLDLTEAMRRVAREAARALGADTVGAYVPGPEGTTLRALAGYHVPPHLREALTRFAMPLKNHRLLVEAWEEERSACSTDVTSDPRVDRKVVERFPHRSLLFVPMLAKGELLGGLFAVWWTEAHAFTAEELRLADGIGRQAALAVENARVLADAERRRRAAESLAEMGRALSGSLDPDVVARRIIHDLEALLHAQHCTLYRLDPESGDLVALAASGDIGPTGGRDVVLPLGTGACGLALRERGPVVTEDLLADPRVTLLAADRARIEQAPFRAVLATPLLVGDRAIGALAVGDRAGRVFDAEEIRLAQAFADQAALALDNARLYTETEARRRAAEALAAVGAAITESLDRQAILELVAEHASRLLGTERSAVALLEPGDPEPVIRFVARRAMSPQFPRRMQPQHANDGTTPTAIRERRPVWSADILSDPAFDLAPATRAAVEAEGYRAVLSVPLITGDRVLGALVVYRDAPGPFLQEHVDLLRAFASHAAIAIENARLYTETERRRRVAESLAELGRLLSQSLHPDVVAQRIVGSVGALLGVQNAVLYRLDPESGDLIATAVSGDVSSTLGRDVAFRRGSGVVGVAVGTRQLVATRDLLADPRFTFEPEVRARIEQSPYRSALAVPLTVQDRVIGALGIGDRPGREFTPEEVQLTQAFADQAALALENARLYEERTRAYEELQRTQDQLAQAQKMEAVGRLAGGVAHDFNNLLTVILGRGEMLLRRLEPENPLQRHVALIQKTAQRAAGLTQQLLAFSRRQVLQPKVLDLNAVVAGLAPMLRRLIGEDVDLVTTADTGLASVRADPTQIEQVILNLAVNARDAMPDGGRLSIETGRVELDAAYARRRPYLQPGPYVMLAVSDTGVGMDAETQAHVFEPFFTTKGPDKGTGLGLATVYGIVKQSGGNIDVDSKPGHGTTFKVFFPPAEDVAEVVEPAAAAELPRGRETVLLVEDEEGVRDLAREILESQGYTVLEARHPGEALLLCERHDGPIDLLVTDVVMPEMSGRAVADRVTRERADTRVLFVSGYTGEAIARHGVLEPGMAFVQKPFTPDALARKVREVLDARPPSPSPREARGEGEAGRVPSPSP